MIWIALAPWLILIKKDNRPVLSSALAGTAFFMINLAWLRHVTYSAWILLSLYSMGYFVIFGFSANLIIKRLRLPLTAIAPFLWVGFEYARSFLLTGFPWLFLGHTQYRYQSLIQISDITGVYGISFLVVLINAGIAELILILSADYRRQKSSFYILNIIFPIVLFITSALYGRFCLKHYIPENGPNVSVVQGNIPQSVKNDPDEMRQFENLQKYVNLSLLTGGEHEKVDLVIWPETMTPGLLNIDPDLSGRNIDRISQESLKNLAYVLDVCLLVGGTAIEIERDKQTFYNSAFYLNEKGVIVDRYDKIHLVPFGEYTPLKRYLPLLARLVPYEVSLSHGKKRVVFSLFDEDVMKMYRFGVLICYEDTVPALVRKFANDGVDFMINITNDGWFRKSSELDQHLAIMVFRAVENRVGMVRSANTGISAFIDANGRIYDKLKDSYGEYKGISGTLTNRVMINKRTAYTWYTKNGDIFAVLCVAISGIVLLGAIIKKVKGEG